MLAGELKLWTRMIFKRALSSVKNFPSLHRFTLRLKDRTKNPALSFCARTFDCHKSQNCSFFFTFASHDAVENSKTRSKQDENNDPDQAYCENHENPSAFQWSEK
jgi:hypothetical protein